MNNLRVLNNFSENHIISVIVSIQLGFRSSAFACVETFIENNPCNGVNKPLNQLVKTYPNIFYLNMMTVNSAFFYQRLHAVLFELFTLIGNFEILKITITTCMLRFKQLMRDTFNSRAVGLICTFVITYNMHI